MAWHPVESILFVGYDDGTLHAFNSVCDISLNVFYGLSLRFDLQTTADAIDISLAGSRRLSCLAVDRFNGRLAIGNDAYISLFHAADRGGYL